MWNRKLILGALVTAAVLPLTAAADVGIYFDVAPPAPRYEVVPAPRAGYIWAPGYWDTRGHNHVWTKGHWERDRKGYTFAPSRWEQRDGRWYLERGRWDKARVASNGDRDHDGTPNRYDRDRDGDGVPNKNDRSPDNPRRQ